MVELSLVAALGAAGIAHETTGAFGLGIGEQVAYTSFEPRAQAASLKVEHTVSAPKFTPLKLSFSFVLPSGMGLSVRIPVIHVSGFEASINLGAHWNTWTPMTNKGYRRATDATVSLRLSQAVTKNISAVIEQQQFILDAKALREFGPIAVSMYQESFSCGQTYFGLSYRW